MATDLEILKEAFSRHATKHARCCMSDNAIDCYCGLHVHIDPDVFLTTKADTGDFIVHESVRVRIIRRVALMALVDAAEVISG